MLNLSNALKILNLSKKYTIYNIENLDIHELKKYYYICINKYYELPRYNKKPNTDKGSM